MKIEVLKASILAVLAASLLGAATYLVSLRVPIEERKPNFTLDAFTPRGGQGSTVVSSPYLYNETISIYALMKDKSNNPVVNSPVFFQIHGPPNSYNNVTFQETAMTNASGIALAILNLTAPFDLAHRETVIGIWSVVATPQIESGEEIADTFAFEVEQPSPYIDVYTDRGGQGPNVSSPSYKLGENLTIYALVNDGFGPREGFLVAFTAFNTNSTDTDVPVVHGSKVSDVSGIASTSFRLHPTYPAFLGMWQVLATVEINGQAYLDTLTFECNP